MPAWDKLLCRALGAIDLLEQNGTPLARWVLGGGTALMIHHWHRASRDIDLFIDDPQLLGLLSPRLSDVFDSVNEGYEEAAHYIKIKYPEGEIDVIVTAALSRVPQTTFEFQGRPVPIEKPVEIALKKLHYRAANLKPRDIFDIAVVLQTDQAALMNELEVLAPARDKLKTRLATLPEAYLREALAELDIFDPWRPLAMHARGMVEDLVRAIPIPSATPA